MLLKSYLLHRPYGTAFDMTPIEVELIDKSGSFVIFRSALKIAFGQ